MVVDDFVIIRYAFKAVLTSAVYNVVMARNWSEDSLIMLQHEFDVLVLDDEMWEGLRKLGL